MTEDSDWWEYRKKRIAEKEIQDLENEITELKRTIELLDDSDRIR